MTSERSDKGGSPLSALGGESRPAPGLVGPCGYCCAYLAFKLKEPMVIDASDRVEYAVHLVVSHGFVR